MTDHDVDAVVERVAIDLAFPVIDRARVRATLESIRPGDRLPGGGVWVPEEPSVEMQIAGLQAFLAQLPPMGDPPAEGQELTDSEAAQRWMALGERVRNGKEMAAIYRAMISAAGK